MSKTILTLTNSLTMAGYGERKIEIIMRLGDTTRCHGDQEYHISISLASNVGMHISAQFGANQYTGSISTNRELRRRESTSNSYTHQLSYKRKATQTYVI